MAASARRAFRRPVLALGMSLMAWAGLNFSAVAPNDPDMEIRFGKYHGMRMNDLQKQDPGYCRWLTSDHDDPSPALLEAAQWIRENAQWINEPSVGFGKYKGMPLAGLCEEDPSYCEWILETAASGEAGWKLTQAADWIQKNRPQLC